MKHALRARSEQATLSIYLYRCNMRAVNYRTLPEHLLKYTQRRTKKNTVLRKIMSTNAAAYDISWPWLRNDHVRTRFMPRCGRGDTVSFPHWQGSIDGNFTYYGYFFASGPFEFGVIIFLFFSFFQWLEHVCRVLDELIPGLQAERIDFFGK